MSPTPTRAISIAGVSLLVGVALLIGTAPANAALFPVTLRLEVAGPDGVFVPVPSGGQFAASSITPTTARWTLGNPKGASQSGFYLYSYGPDCLVSGITIAANSTYVCTETIQPASAFGPQNVGALGGLYDGTFDTALPYPVVVDSVDDTNGQSVTLSATTVDPGGSIVIAGSGFDDDDELTGILTSTPVPLGSFPLSGGTFSYTLAIPAGLEPGVHTVTVYSNGVAYAARSFTLTGPQLAASGVEAHVPLALAGGLLAIGAALVVVARRRRPVNHFT